jgi:hypothetical protein
VNNISKSPSSLPLSQHRLSTSAAARPGRHPPAQKAPAAQATGALNPDIFFASLSSSAPNPRPSGFRRHGKPPRGHAASSLALPYASIFPALPIYLFFFRDFVFYKFRADFPPCTSVAAAAGRPHRASPEAPWQAPGPR